MLFALACVLTVGTLVATMAVGLVGLRLDDSAELLLRSELRLAELRRMRASQLDFADASELAEGVVEGGTRAVQVVHQGIAAIPFGILEAIPPTRPVTRVVRVAHDVIAGGVYGAISWVNRGLGRALRGTGAESKPKKP